jgi:Leucine-rich repeat (LRR) protein
MLRAFQTSALARPSGTIIAVEEELRGQLIPGVLKLGFAVLSKTKVPDVAIYPVEASAQRLERTKKVVERAWKVIKSGVFLPSPSPLHCPTCPFRAQGQGRQVADHCQHPVAVLLQQSDAMFFCVVDFFSHWREDIAFGLARQANRHYAVWGRNASYGWPGLEIKNSSGIFAGQKMNSGNLFVLLEIVFLPLIVSWNGRTVSGSDSETIQSTEVQIDKVDPGQSDSQQERVIDEITKLGGKVKRVEKPSGNPRIEVALTGPKFTKKALALLQKVKGLDVLDLRFSSLDNKDLLCLTGLKNLKRLDIGGTKIMDGGLEFFETFTILEELNLDNMPIGDKGVEHLKLLKNLRSLDLGRTNVADKGLSYLKDLTNLQSLNISKTKITDAGLIHLKHFKNLEGLGLALMGRQISGPGLAHLRKVQKLKSLWLHGTILSDADLVHLKLLVELRQLVLTETPIGNQGIVHLAALKLDFLDLEGTKVGDPGVAHLSKITTLQNLSLDWTLVSDQSIGELQKLSNLQNLSIQRTRISEKGFEMLKKALPRTKINY